MSPEFSSAQARWRAEARSGGRIKSTIAIRSTGCNDRQLVVAPPVRMLNAWH